MSRLFTPKRADGIAEHRIVADLILDRSIGDTVTYDELAAALGHDHVDRRRLQAIARRANSELRRDHQRSIEAVVNLGYRVLRPSEHVMQARRYRDRSRRSMKTGVQVLRATDLDQLTADEQQRAVGEMMAMSRVVQAIEYLDRERGKHAGLIEGLRRQAAGDHETLRAHDEALRSAGILPPAEDPGPSVDG